MTAKCRELQACSSQLQVQILLADAMGHWCPFLIAGSGQGVYKLSVLYHSKLFVGLEHGVLG